MTATPDSILTGGRIATLNPLRPEVEAVSIVEGRFAVVGDANTVLASRGPHTDVISLNGRRVIPGLIDSHIHVIRGGLNYNMELRWDGVPSLSEAMGLLKRQVARTPPPQWVRVVGGFTEHQFAEKRLPTLEELNAIAPDTPVFILHLYDRALLNGAALRAVGYSRTTTDPQGAQIVRDRRGNPTGLLLARPNAALLYATLAKGPKLPEEYQRNSTLHFMRELNRLGVTSVIDAGGGSQNYPEDYAVINQLESQGELTLRVSYNLFTQNPREELADFVKWAHLLKPRDGTDSLKFNGAGEMLVFSAADFEDFREPRMEIPVTMESELESVVGLLARYRWPWRLHATYDQTIDLALNAIERVAKEVPLTGLNWFIDHAETISPRNIDRVAALGGGIAVQHRMAFQGEYFIERYGAAAARAAPPITRMLSAGIPVGAGTDATRVASYNPWVSLAWLVTGKTVGGTSLYPPANLLDRERALRLWTEANAWFSSDVGNRGAIREGQLADLAVLSEDYFRVPDEEISSLSSVLTMVGGRIVHADAEYRDRSPPLPAPMPDWSPSRLAKDLVPSEPRREAAVRSRQMNCHSCANEGMSDAVDGFWGLGCSCWAF
jgi:predicted amidohydrolase YtcJ